jgi:hypothetical protein
MLLVTSLLGEFYFNSAFVSWYRVIGLVADSAL